MESQAQETEKPKAKAFGKIVPLVMEIREICKEAKISHVCEFELDLVEGDHVMAESVLLFEDKESNVDNRLVCQVAEFVNRFVVQEIGTIVKKSEANNVFFFC